jgi:transcription initiation factor IIE alpha subunit
METLTKGIYMQHHHSPTPKNIARAKEFTYTESQFYSRLYSLMKKHGYCSATSEELGKCVKKCPRHIRRYLRKFRDLGMIVIEIEKNYRRRIWTVEDWNLNFRK